MKHIYMKQFSVFTILSILFLIGSNASATCTVDPNDFEYSMTITGELLIDGELSTDVNDMVYAYVDGECRGSAQVMHISQVDVYIVMLTVFSNQLSGENLEFKIMDNSITTLLDCSNELTFTADNNLGTPSNPYQIAYSTATEIDDALEVNAINLFPNPTTGVVNIQFKSILSGTVNIISTSGQVVESHMIRESSMKLNLFHLPKGIYLVQIVSGESTYTTKVMIE